MQGIVNKELIFLTISPCLSQGILKYLTHEKMEEILFKLLEQSAVVVSLGVGIYAIWKEKAKKEAEHVTERKEANVRLEKIVREHQNELKEIYKGVHQRELDQIQTLKDLTVILNNVEENQEKLLNNRNKN